jgi:hypothetical protein
VRKVTRRSALWRADLDGGICAAPEECAEALDGRDDVTLALEHRLYGRAAAKRVFATTLRQDVEWQFDGIAWPEDVQVGVLVTVTWPGGSGADVQVRTTPLDEPVRVDGVPYYHEYDPKVVTREFADAGSNRGKVLAAVRKLGRVFADGSAVLAEEGLGARAGLGRGAKGQFLLANAVDQLLREGYLTRVTGSADKAGYPSYPAVEGEKPAEMLFYAPLVEEAELWDDEDASGRREHWVNGFVRKLPPGAHPSEKQLSLADEQVGPLEPGFTYVQKHHRQG